MNTAISTSEIVAAGLGDLDALTALEASLQAFPWSRGNFADSLAAGHDVWLCRADGEIVGYAVVMRALDEAHLLVLGVDRRRQGQGFGAGLLLCAMRASAAVGVRRMLLEVRASNVRAIAFYEDFGFARIGQRRGYYPAAVGREDALVLARELPWE